jgi:hypothetical protein
VYKTVFNFNTTSSYVDAERKGREINKRFGMIVRIWTGGGYGGEGKGAASCWLVLGQMVGIYVTTSQQNLRWVQGSLNEIQEAKNVNKLGKQFHSSANNGPQGYGNQESVGEVDFNLDTMRKSCFKASIAAASFKGFIRWKVMLVRIFVFP